MANEKKIQGRQDRSLPRYQYGDYYLSVSFDANGKTRRKMVKATPEWKSNLGKIR